MCKDSDNAPIILKFVAALTSNRMKPTRLIPLTATLLIIASTALSGTAVAQSAIPPMSVMPRTTTGTIENIVRFHSEYIPSRDVHIWLPEGYNPDTRYGVLYMHDGQALFDPDCNWNHQAWEVDSVAGAMIARGEGEPFIVVGIDNTDARRFEYMPQKALDYLPANDSLLLELDRSQFVADNYLKFIVTELKPWVDARYSTLTDARHTAIMGSSMGGLISLYALCEYPEVFGAAACLSTHSPMTLVMSPTSADSWSLAFRRYLHDRLPEANSHRLYFDIGDQTLDALYPHYQALLDAEIQAAGWIAPYFITERYTNAAHDEQSWRRRLHVPLLMLFGKR